MTAEADLAALRALYPLYLHDLSEFTDHYRLDERGEWSPSYLEDFLFVRGQHGRVLRDEHGAAVGFAHVATRPFEFMDPRADVRLAEFFVARPARRRGLGARFAREVLADFPGRWQIDVLTANAPALAFWRAVLDPPATEEPGEGDVLLWWPSPPPASGGGRAAGVG